MRTRAQLIKTRPNVERFCLVTVVTLVVAYTLSPFEFTLSRASVEGGDSQVASIGGVLKSVGHVVAFLVLGVLIATVYERAMARRSLGWFLPVAAIFCVGLEVVQMLDASRHARITDLLFNLTGLSLGVISLRWSRMRVKVAGLQARLRQHTVRFLIVVFLLGTGIWFAASLYPMTGVLKLDWDKNFHLVIGNEVNQTRPWLGEIRHVGIYGKALTAEQVKALRQNRSASHANDAGAQLNLLVGYGFTRGQSNEVAAKGALGSVDMVLEIPSVTEWATHGGLLLKQPALLVSRGSGSNLAAAIMDSGAFSVEASVRPLTAVQMGPARIVSLSDGIWSRNFTLGQERSDLVFRVRNGVNGSNGLRHALRVRSALDVSLRHVVAVYDHGVSSILMDGKPCGPTVDLREPFVHLLLGSCEAGRAVGSLLLTLVIALPAYSLASLFCRGWFRHLTAVTVTFCAGVLPYGLTCLIVGGPWRWNLFFWFAIALVTVYPLGLVYVCRS